MKKDSNIQKKGIYYKTTIRLVVTFAICLVLFSTSIIYYFLKQWAENKTYQNKKELLEQVEINFNYIDLIINDFGMSLLMNTDVKELMFSQEIDVIKNFRTINSIQTNNSLKDGIVQAVYIYSCNTDVVYSTYGILDLDTSQLREIIPFRDSTTKNVPRMRDRIFATTNAQNKVCTYFFTNEISLDNNIGNFIAIDINVDWIMNNLKRIDNSNVNSQTETIIFDNQKESLSLIKDKKTISKFLEYSNEKNLSDKNGFFRKTIDGKDHFITYVKFEKYDWVLFNDILTSEIYQDMKMIKYLWLISTAVLIFLGVAASWFITRIIYQPIKSTITRVDDSFFIDKEKSPINEMSIINAVISQSSEAMGKFKSIETSFKKEDAKKYKKMILEDSLSITEEHISVINQQEQEILEINETSIIILFEISSIFENNDELGDSIYLYACDNYFSEVIKRIFPNTISFIKNNSKVVFIVNKFYSTHKEILTNLIIKSKVVFNSYFNVCLKVTLSLCYENLIETTEIYKNTSKLSCYHILEPEDMILDIEQIIMNEKNHKLSYSEALNLKLEKAINLENIDKVKSAINDIYQQIKILRYNYMSLSIMRIIDVTEEVIKDKNSSVLFDSSVSFDKIRIKAANNCAISVFINDYLILIEKYFNELRSKKDTKYEKVIEMIILFINDNYQDTSLSIQMIADKFKLSPKYLSHTFKSITNKSMLDYIINKRLVVACDLLISTELSTAEIVLRVGIENENYFYTLFKKHIGVTPKQYRQLKTNFYKGE